MCRLIAFYINGEKFTGYKYVLVNKKTGRVYSPATGVEYVAGQRVPVRRGRARLQDVGFMEDVCLLRSPAFEPDMIGRTCAFVEENNARDMLRMHKGCAVVSNGEDVTEQYDKAVAKITLSQSLMRGYYSGPVVGGKFIEEIELKW